MTDTHCSKHKRVLRRNSRQTIAPLTSMVTIAFLTSAGIKGLAQDSMELRGAVVSKHGTPLSGVNIVLDKTTVGTVTDACGLFKLKIPKGKPGRLSFSMITMPYYFDVMQIRERDLQNGIVFKIMSSDAGDSRKEKRSQRRESGCEKFVKPAIFRLTEKHRELLNDH